MNKKEKDLSYRINNEIKSEKVRLVGNNIDTDIYDFKTALNIARQQELDLIEINPKSDPPVCKIEDYGKFLYNMKKKQKDIDKNNKSNKMEVKEMRFTPNIDEHDYEFKKNHIIKFIKDGDKVKVYVFFKGREINYIDKGQIILLKLADELSDISSVEKMPSLEGNKMMMFLKPKR